MKKRISFLTCSVSVCILQPVTFYLLWYCTWSGAQIEVLYGPAPFLHWSTHLKPRFSMALSSAISPHCTLTPGEVTLSWDFNIAIQISLPPRLQPRYLFGAPPNIYTCFVKASISPGSSLGTFNLNCPMPHSSPYLQTSSFCSVLYVMIWWLEKPSIRLFKPEISFFLDFSLSLTLPGT